MTLELIADLNAAVTATAPRRAFEGFFADPNLVRFGDRWWIYPTTDGRADWGASAFRAYSSPDLVEWHDEGEVFSLPEHTGWATRFAWAPAAVEHRGRYFLFFTAEDNIGVAVADAPAGPFRDSGSPLVTAGAHPGRAIDPSVFLDSDGRHYLLWGNQTANIVPLAEDLLSFDPAAVVSFRPGDFREAAWLHRRGDTYYLSWSENDTRDAAYRVCYATSDSPYGPWLEQGVLLEQDPATGEAATGHHSIAGDGDEWFIAYHRFATPHGDGFHREVVVTGLTHLNGGLLQPARPTDSRTPPGSSIADRRSLSSTTTDHRTPNTER